MEPHRNGKRAAAVSYLDEDYARAELDHQTFRAIADPVWYDPTSKRCEHAIFDAEKNIKVTRVVDAGSDGAYVLYQCRVCSREFCRFIEG